MDERVRAIVAAHRDERGALLPILHALQEEFGWLEPAAVPLVARELNLSEAEVHGTASFYHDFRRTPPARRTVRICRAEACQAVGAEALATHASTKLGVGMGETADDGSVSLQQVFCFGNCALGPTVEVDGRLHGRVGPERFDTLVGAHD